MTQRTATACNQPDADNCPGMPGTRLRRAIPDGETPRMMPKRLPVGFAAATSNILVALCLLLSASGAWAFACTSAGGNWATAGTWASCNGTTPQAGDTATITAGTVTLNTSATIAGLIVNGGTLAFGNNTTVRTLSVNGNVTVAAGANLNVANFTVTHVLNVSGNITNNGTFDLVLDNNSLCTLNFTGGGAHTVGGTSAGTTEFSDVTTANNLTINKTGAVITQTGTLGVTGNLTVTAGTLNLANATTVSGVTSVSGTLGHTTNTGTRTFTGAVTIQSGGVWTNTTAAVGFNSDLTINGTFTSGTGLYTFGGAAVQTITNSVGTTVFGGSVTLNNTNGLVLGGTNNVTVTTTLTLTNGRVTTGSNVLYIASGNNIASVSATKFIVGNLRKPFSGGVLTHIFEVGTTTGASKYAPVTITFAAVSVAGDITVSTTYGNHPQIASSGIDTAQHVNRYWTITNAGVGFTTYTATFTFVAGAPAAGDIDAGADPMAFVASRYGGTSWNATTYGANTATSIQISGETGFGDFVVGAVVGYNAGLGRFNAYDPPPVTPAGAVQGYIRTKLAGTTPAENFTLTIVHLNAAGTALATFGGGGNTTVTVALIDGSAMTAPFANNCWSNWLTATPIASVPLTFINNSTTTATAAFTIPNAYRNVRVRIATPAGGGQQIGCSGDLFAIRPTAFSVTSTNANNTNTTGPPAIKTGANFTLDATAIPGYDGTPVVDNTIGRVSGSPTAGTIGGSFSAAGIGTGVATGAAFTYSEVGNFGLNANTVYDSSFTGVDQPNDCISGFSNTLTGGRYGCSFGNTAIAQSTGSSGFGRFTPDHFDLGAGNIVNRSDVNAGAGCAPASGFTYMGEPMLASFTLTAKNSAGAVTQNYAGAAYPKFTNTTANWTMFGSNDGIGLWMSASNYAVSPGTCNVAFSNATPSVTSYACTGVPNPVSINRAAGPRVTVLTTPAAPAAPAMSWAAGVGSFSAHVTLGKADLVDGPYSTLNIGVAPQDADGVTLVPAALNLDANNDSTPERQKLLVTTAVRYGRFRLANAYGSEKLPLSIMSQTDYFNGAGWAVNSVDNCTVIPLPTLTPNPSGLATTATYANNPVSGGLAGLSLAAPSGGTGYFDLTVIVPNYLEFAWRSATVADPVARATFGLYKGNDRLIYRRERY